MKHKTKRSRWWLAPLSLLILLVLTEMALRLIWEPPQEAVEEIVRLRPFYVVESQQNGVTTYVTNGNALPPPGVPPRVGDPRLLSPARFIMPKPADVIRIFVLGVSPIYGGLEMGGYNLSSYLLRDLKTARPDLRFEVIDAAAQQMDSQMLTEILGEINTFAPDFILTYVGGAVPSVEAPGRHDLLGAEPFLFRLVVFVQDLRLVHLLGQSTRRKLLDSLFTLDHQANNEEEDVNIAENVRRMSEKVLVEGYHALAKAGAGSSARVAFYEIVTDLAGSPPLWSLHKKKLSKTEKTNFIQLLSAGKQALATGDHEQALTVLDQALAIDDTYADVHYQRGLALQAAGRGDEAYEAFVKAREADASHERLFAEPVKPLHDVLSQYNLTLLPSGESFRQASASGVPGRELFRDITHPSQKGLAILGRLGVEWMLPQLPPGGEGMPQPLPPPEAIMHKPLPGGPPVK